MIRWIKRLLEAWKRFLDSADLQNAVNRQYQFAKVTDNLVDFTGHQTSYVQDLRGNYDKGVPSPRSHSEAKAQEFRTKRQREYIEAFGGQIYLSDQLDIAPGRLWDSIAYEAGDAVTPTNSQLFLNVGASSGKTYCETNMTRPGQLPAPEAFSISRILFTFNVAALNEDIYAMAESMVYSLWLGQKWYARNLMISMHSSYAMLAPLRICTYCASVYVSNDPCPGCGAQQFVLSDVGMTEQAPGRQFYMDFPNPIVIANQINFHVDFLLRPYRTKGTVKMWCHFEGLHARGVQ